MTDLAGHLAAGYRHAMHPGGPDPAPACAAEVPREALLAEARRLEPVQQRCHISRVRLAFIRRVLDLSPKSAA